MIKFYSLMFCLLLIISFSGNACSDESDDTKTELEGSWSKCINTAGIQVKIIYYFADNALSVNTSEYYDNQCTNIISGRLSRRTYIFDLGNTLVTSDASEAVREINLFNGNLYNYNNDGTLDTIEAADSIFQIFRIENDKLYFGDIEGTLDGTSAEKRPATLIKDSFFQRI